MFGSLSVLGMAIWVVWGVVLPNIRYTNLRYSYWGALLVLQKGGQSDYKREVTRGDEGRACSLI